MEALPPVGSSCSKKRAPLSCQANERASPPTYISVPLPHLEMAHEFWQCCHLLGDAGTERQEEGTEVRQK